MSALVSEMYYPPDQYVKKEKVNSEGATAVDDDGNTVFESVLRDGAKGYKIRPLTSLQFTEVQTLGQASLTGFRFNFQVIKQLLAYGLDCENRAKVVEAMPSAHHALVAREIFLKSSIADEERKNS